jgi:hypothetical protein
MFASETPLPGGHRGKVACLGLHNLNVVADNCGTVDRVQDAQDETPGTGNGTNPHAKGLDRAGPEHWHWHGWP